MTFKPYCNDCSTWHSEQEGHGSLCDGAGAITVLAAVRHCANSWDGNAHERGTVTYDLGDGRWATFEARNVERFGLARLLEAYGVAMPTERVPVIRNGWRIGTMPPDFDPAFARSISFMYDYRPGDLVREGDAWVVGRSMGAGDIDCVAGFVRDAAASPS